MDPRSKELAVLDRCVLATRGTLTSPADQVEADVFRYAAMLLTTDFPDAAQELWAVHQAYYAEHPGSPASYPSLMAEGVVTEPGRFTEMLKQRLREHEHRAASEVPH